MHNNSIIEWTIDQPVHFFGTIWSILLTISSILALLVSTSCLIFVHYYLQINPCIHSLLHWHAIELCFCNFLSIIGHLAMSFESRASVITCCLALSPITVIAYLQTNVHMSISTTRFHVIWKAERSEIINHGYLKVATLVNKSLSYFIMFLLNFVCVWFQVESEAITCAQVPNYLQNNDYKMILDCFYFVPLLSHMIVAVMFDQKLKKIFKARSNNKNQPINLVPWQAIGANLNEDNVPQRATNISIYMLIITIITAPLYYMGIEDLDSSLLYISLLHMSFGEVLHLPLTLMFTVKHTFELKKLRNVSQPPQELQFHDIFTIPINELECQDENIEDPKKEPPCGHKRKLSGPNPRSDEDTIENSEVLLRPLAEVAVFSRKKFKNQSSGKYKETLTPVE